MGREEERRGTAPPAPQLMIGREDELTALRHELLIGFQSSAGRVKFDGTILRARIEETGRKREDIAKATGTSSKTLYRAEQEDNVYESTARDIAKELQAPLETLIQLPLTKNVVVVHAAAGMGKTTLLQALCQDSTVLATLPDGILWAPIGQRPDIQTILLQWAFSMRLPELEKLKGLGDQVTTEFVRATLNAVLSRKRVLILLDDVWDADHASALMVGGASSPVLVTTRHLQVANQLVSSAGAAIALNPLREGESVLLLQTIAGEIINNHPDQALELAVQLEGHPLALQVASRLIATHHTAGLDAVAVMQKLREPQTLLEQRAPGDHGETPRTVEAILKISTDALSETERLCFAFLSSWEAKPAPIDLRMMARSWKPFGVDTEQMAMVLAGCGLVQPLGDGKFWIHGLLVAHGRSLLRSMSKNARQ